MSAAPNPNGHEHRDVRFAPVLAGGAAVIALVLLSAAAMVGLFDSLVAREARQSAPANPLSAAAARQPPAPRLQTHPIDDLRALRAAEAKRLAGYAWVDRERGLVQIPIERAMDLLVERRGSAAEAAK